MIDTFEIFIFVFSDDFEGDIVREGKCLFVILVYVIDICMGFDQIFNA